SFKVNTDALLLNDGVIGPEFIRISDAISTPFERLNTLFCKPPLPNCAQGIILSALGSTTFGLEVLVNISSYHLVILKLVFIPMLENITEAFSGSPNRTSPTGSTTST